MNKPWFDRLISARFAKLLGIVAASALALLALTISAAAVFELPISRGPVLVAELVEYWAMALSIFGLFLMVFAWVVLKLLRKSGALDREPVRLLGEMNDTDKADSAKR